MKVFLVYYRAADAFSGAPRLVGASLDRERAIEWADERYPGYGPDARDYSIAEQELIEPAPPAADVECACFWTDPKDWTVHYGAVEPASTREWNPECPVHPAAGPVVQLDPAQAELMIPGGDLCPHGRTTYTRCIDCTPDTFAPPA